MMFERIALFPAGFFGLIAVLINYALGNKLSTTDFCAIPGLSSLSSNLIPQNLLFNSTVLVYIAAYFTTVGASAANYFWILGGVLVAIQGFTGYSTDCYNEFLSAETPGKLYRIGLGIAIVGIVGGLAGYLIARYVKTPTSSSPLILPAKPNLGPGGEQRTIPGKTNAGGVGGAQSSEPGVGTCSPPNDEDQFVCETYKNGKLVTSTISE